MKVNEVKQQFANYFNNVLCLKGLTDIRKISCGFYEVGNGVFLFKLQDGPIKEVGVNGCQIDDVISWCRDVIDGFNTNFPCRENSLVLNKLDEALLWLLKRKMDREKRGVEGKNKK